MSFILANLPAALLSISVYYKYIILAYIEIREFPMDFSLLTLWICIAFFFSSLLNRLLGRKWKKQQQYRITQWLSNIVTCVGNIYSSTIRSVCMKKICELIRTLFILHSDFSILFHSWKMLDYDLLNSGFHDQEWVLIQVWRDGIKSRGPRVSLPRNPDSTVTGVGSHSHWVTPWKLWLWLPWDRNGDNTLPPQRIIERMRRGHG